MSTHDFQGHVHAFQQFMQAAQDDIASGKRRPAEQRFDRADDEKVSLNARTRRIEAVRARLRRFTA